MTLGRRKDANTQKIIQSDSDRPIYGIAIYGVIKTGNAEEKKKLAVQARKHLNEVKAALAALEKKIASN